MIGAAALPSLAGVIAQNFGLHYVAGALLVMAVVLLVLHEVLLASEAVKPRMNANRHE